MSRLFAVLSLVTRSAHRNEPCNWFAADVSPGVSLVMNLCRAPAAEYTSMVVSLEDNIALPLPSVRRQILISIISRSSCSLLLPSPPGEHRCGGDDSKKDEQQRQKSE